MQQILIFGNSGAGKSTLAARLARVHGLAHLDLDTLAWQSGTPPRRRPLADSIADIDAFIASACASGWVIEGCYADLLTHAAQHCTRMIFLNPGIDACIAHCRARPWEPHKYPSKEAQEANLPMLLDWVREYAVRDDDFSLAAHRGLFEGYTGEKQEFTAPSSTPFAAS
jgi:adenylate kinase family enzyme